MPQLLVGGKQRQGSGSQADWQLAVPPTTATQVEAGEALLSHAAPGAGTQGGGGREAEQQAGGRPSGGAHLRRIRDSALVQSQVCVCVRGGGGRAGTAQERGGAPKKKRWQGQLPACLRAYGQRHAMIPRFLSLSFDSPALLPYLQPSTLPRTCVCPCAGHHGGAAAGGAQPGT